MPSLFYFLVRLGHLVTAVHQKDLLTYIVISSVLQRTLRLFFSLYYHFFFIFGFLSLGACYVSSVTFPREPDNISSFFMFLFYCWRSRLVNDPLCSDRLRLLVAKARLWICLYLNGCFHRLLHFHPICGRYRGIRACLKDCYEESDSFC